MASAAGGGLALMIHEVRNTFGEINAHVLPVKPGDLTDAGLRQQQDDLFYVSPFVLTTMRYHFRILPPLIPSGCASSQPTATARCLGPPSTAAVAR
jgi:DUF1365 family protein